MRITAVLVALFSLALPVAYSHTQAPAEYKLVRSISGALGTLKGDEFVIEQPRERFVFPQDKSLVVYFEWDAAPGSHSLSARWKNPEGKAITLSSEVRIETTGRRLRSYWTYYLNADMMSGVWEVEIRINGTPAGSHPFEVVVPEKPPVPVAPSAPPPPAPPSVAELYKSAASVVFIHKLDEKAVRIGTACGFFVRPGRVATAFQAIDGASRLEIEFADGTRKSTELIAGWDRLGDWAVVEVDANSVPPLAVKTEGPPGVGDSLVLFNVEGETQKVIGTVALSGVGRNAANQEIWQTNPQPTVESVGGPVMDSFGRVIGIMTGNGIPGSRATRRDRGVGSRAWAVSTLARGVVPIGKLRFDGTAATLAELNAKGELTPLLTEQPNLVAGGTVARLTGADEGFFATDDTMEFSRQQESVFVYTLWVRKDKQKDGMISAQVLNAFNRPVINVAPSKAKLGDGIPRRHAFKFSPAALQPGFYRIDVKWNEAPVWRGFIKIVN